MSSRLGKHLLRATFKAENFGLFALYTWGFFCFFFLLFGCSMANFRLFLRKNSHSPDINIAFRLSFFGAKVTRRGSVSTPN